MHYVCADIHGNLERYQKMIEQIQIDDTLYILGDVIDRGQSGIEILKDIMKHDNVNLLLGNHEDMMLQSLVNDNDNEHLNWVQLCNGGGITEYMFNLESPLVQQDILQYLENRPLSVKLECGDITYVLCHAGTIPGKENLLYKDASKQDRYMMLWMSPLREDCNSPLELYNPDYHYIVGHVPVQRIGYQTIYTIFNTNITDIDCGCSYIHETENTSLALLCLENFSCQYFS